MVMMEGGHIKNVDVKKTTCLSWKLKMILMERYSV